MQLELLRSVRIIVVCILITGEVRVKNIQKAVFKEYS